MSITASHQARSLRLLGVVWLLVGVSTYVNPPNLPGEAFILEALPVEVRAALWGTSGMLAVVLSYCRGDMGRWGYTALVIPAALRAFSYAYAGVVWLLSGGEVSTGVAWVSALSWVFVVLFVLHEAATPEAATPEAIR